MDSDGITIWIANAHGDDGKRFVVRADENTDCVHGTGKGDTRVLGDFGLVMAAQKYAG